MKFKILQENLLSALLLTGRIIPSKPQLPVLQNVLLLTEEGRVKLVATNMETTEVVWIGAKVEKEGGACVSARLLTDFISSVPQGTITVSQAETVTVIEGVRTKASIPGVAPVEFPPVPIKSSKNAVSVDLNLFSDALRSVLFSAATDEGRPILTGVKIQKQKEKLQIVATDGYRLSVKKINLPFKEEVDMIVPARALGEIAKNDTDKKTKKEMLLKKTEDGQLAFLMEDREIYTRLINGEYPGFERIIPSSWSTRAKIEREQLFRAVKTAAVFARDNANIIRMKIDSEKIEISANTPQVGESSVEIDASTEGDGGEIAFNSRFLLDYLNAFSEEELFFEMTGSLNPGVFRPVRDDSSFHIIMPVRLQG